eukprot:1743183-Amphidinium_carterae.2
MLGGPGRIDCTVHWTSMAIQAIVSMVKQGHSRRNQESSLSALCYNTDSISMLDNGCCDNFCCHSLENRGSTPTPPQSIDCNPRVSKNISLKNGTQTTEKRTILGKSI